MADRDGEGQRPEWLSRLAHDLRNPITPMRSAVQLLQLGQLPPELAADLLRTLDRQIDFLLHLIDDVSDLVRIEKDAFVMRPMACDLGAAVNAAVTRHARRGGKAAPAIAVDAPPAALLVRADEVRLRQLIETLLGCIGTGADAAAPATVTLRRDGDMALVRIADAERPFGPNACLDFLATGTVPGDASALTMGHLVARRILELHDATLVVSEGGTAIELRLPTADPG